MWRDLTKHCTAGNRRGACAESVCFPFIQRTTAEGASYFFPCSPANNCLLTWLLLQAVLITANLAQKRGLQNFSTFIALSSSIWLAIFHLTKGKITISCFCSRILILFLSTWALKRSFIPRNYLFLTVFEQCEELFTETACTVLVWHITEGHYFQRFLIINLSI